MSRKIIDFKVLSNKSLEDMEYDINAGERFSASITNKPVPDKRTEIVRGLNYQITELISLGYEPFGELKMIDSVSRYKSICPAPDLSQETVSTTSYWVREFVKYADNG